MDDRLPEGTKVQLMTGGIPERRGVILSRPDGWESYMEPNEYLIDIGGLHPYIGTTDPSVTKENLRGHYIEAIRS